MGNFKLEHIESSYKKLKSYVYFSKNLIHLKKKIIDFEDKRTIKSCFDNLQKALNSNDNSYFDELISKINYIPKIKKIKENNMTTDVNLVSNKSNQETLVIEKINYFIDMPIELFIIDTLWTLLMGKRKQNDKFDYKHVKANRFAYNLFSDDEGIDGINFQDLNIFTPYFNNYVNWKKGAINKANDLYNESSDSMIISLDLTKYYYSVNVSFEGYESISKIGNFCFIYLTKIIKKIYCYYSNIMKTILKLQNVNRTVIPIGLISSGLIANDYLDDFDKKISSVEKVEYYSRYVDDILIVVPFIIEDNALNIIKRIFKDIFNFDKKYIYLKNYDGVKIQNDKIKIILNYYDDSNSIIESLSREIPDSSDANLMPNIEYSELDNFILDVHKKKVIRLKLEMQII